MLPLSQTRVELDVAPKVERHVFDGEDEIGVRLDLVRDLGRA
jgi:hypothetical protein